MSYSIIESEMVEDQINNEPVQPIKRVRDHRNEKNPHYNKPHTDSAKSRISATQKARYDLLRTAVEKANNQISESRVKEIVKETIDEYLAKNAKLVDNKKINITL